MIELRRNQKEPLVTFKKSILGNPLRSLLADAIFKARSHWSFLRHVLSSQIARDLIPMQFRQTYKPSRSLSNTICTVCKEDQLFPRKRGTCNDLLMFYKVGFLASHFCRFFSLVSKCKILHIIHYRFRCNFKRFF